MISKKKAGYVHYPNSDYDCDDCPLWITPGDRCVVHGPEDELLAHDSCNWNVQGQPNQLGTAALGFLSKETSGFVRTTHGCSCKRCEYFGGPQKRACSEVDKDSEGPDPGIIHGNGCCNLWSADSTRGDKPDSYFNIIRSPEINTELSRGIADLTVSPQGKKDIRKLGADIAKVDKIDVIYTSPLWRCLQTAKLIASYFPNCKIHVVEGLTTWSYGGAEGQPASRTGPILLRYAKSQPDTPPPGIGPVSGALGDAFDEWKERIINTGFRPVMRVIEQYPELVIAVVTSSRDIYTYEGWLAAGMPSSLRISFAPMSGEQHPPGAIAKMVKLPSALWTTKWLELSAPDADLGRNKPEGLLIRHGSTAFNEGAG